MCRENRIVIHYPEATVRPLGPLRVNNGDAMKPALIAESGIGILPDPGNPDEPMESGASVAGLHFSLECPLQLRQENWKLD
jgi:hypothetical protein